MAYRSIIFDLDGTLLDTLEDLADAANTALTRLGFPVHPVCAYRGFVGDGALELMRRVLPAGKRDDKTLKKCHQMFLESYACGWHTKTRPYPGIAELLDKLIAGKIKTAILSNKPHDIAVKTVETLLPKWHFEIVLGQREGFPRKPDPGGALEIARQLRRPVSGFVFVGDSGVDMQTAIRAGMLAVGVSWGFRAIEELRQSGAQLLINHPSEILSIMDPEMRVVHGRTPA